MRTKEEVQKMLGKAVNAERVMKEDTRIRQVKEKLHDIMQALNWVLQEDVGMDLTKIMEARIQTLRDAGSTEPKSAVQDLAARLMEA